MNTSTRTRISLLFTCCFLAASCAKEVVKGTAEDELTGSNTLTPQSNADSLPDEVESPVNNNENVADNTPTEVVDEVGTVIEVKPLDQAADPLADPVEAPVMPSEPPKTIEDVKVTCENSVVVEQSIQINFADTRALNNNDNCKNRPVLADMRPELNNVINAYTIESQKFSLPPNTILCGLDIKQVNNANFYYDDHVFLLLNRNVLMSSYPYHAERNFEKLTGNFKYDIFQFDWNKLQEAPQYDNLKDNYPEYCLGADGDPALNEKTDCVVPTSQEVGLFSLKLADKLTQELYFHAKDSKIFDFELVTTGDDNTSKDCRHTALEMSVAIKYVNVPPSNPDAAQAPAEGGAAQ